MCQICKSLIYDIIIDPLSHTHALHAHINFKALAKCAVEVVDCFYRAVQGFPIFPEYFFQPVVPSRYTASTPTVGLGLRIRIPDKALAKFEFEEWLWNKFHTDCPDWAYELQYAIETCVSTGVAIKTRAKEQLIKQFFMEKLSKFLINIPTIHKDHTVKIPIPNRTSPGPVPLWDIIHLRQKAGLPVAHILPKNVYHYP